MYKDDIWGEREKDVQKQEQMFYMFNIIFTELFSELTVVMLNDSLRTYEHTAGHNYS